MAPTRTTRASQAGSGGGVTKKVHRKTHVNREATDSWELLDQQEMDSNQLDRHNGENDMDSVDEALATRGPVDVEKALDPLREMAERVGKEVETFAETLDKFFADLPLVTDRFDAAHDLVLQFRDVAVQRAQELKHTYEREARDQMRKEWSQKNRNLATSAPSQSVFATSDSASLSAKKAGQVHQLRQWQQEADIWELFRVMLELHPFERDQQAIRAENQEKLARLGPVHRYTSDGDLWERFLMEDDLARERSAIKNWLESTADHQVSDIQSIVEELEVKAGRGRGLWSSGWLHTREKIKGEKRIRSWPKDGESPLPQIHRSDNNELLTTQLDPDAPQRQDRSLEKPDAYFEKAIWVACWEMLRRGTPLEAICDWCDDRKEGWRALIMGAATDTSESSTGTAAWRQICLLASQSSGCSDYEAAVLGAIGGNVKAMEKVARSIDDHLYAYYSAALTRQYDHWLKSTVPGRCSSISRNQRAFDESLLDPQEAQLAINDLITRLRTGTSTMSESAQPMKMIQSFLLADEVGSLIDTVGSAIAEDEGLRGTEGLISRPHGVDEDNAEARGERELALNKQTLRITTHMALIHRILSPDYLQGEELIRDENLLIVYIQALRKSGKRLLIPLYASKLRRERYVPVVARVLQDIVEPQEQAHMLRLLREADLDVVAILQEQMSWLMDAHFDKGHNPTPVSMLEPIEEWRLYPGVRIRVDFLEDVVVPSDDAIVRALHWFLLLPGAWDVLFKALTMAMRRCLVTGRIVCARMIVENFPYTDISEQKSREVIGKAIHFMEDELPLAKDEREALTFDLMRRQSRTYYELEALVTATEKLAGWRMEEHQYTEIIKKPFGVPQDIKDAKKYATAAMEPVLHGVLLNPFDDEEAEDLDHIRRTYMPEVVLSYATVLHAAGNLITREFLLDSMDLSVLIATGKNEDGEDNGLLEPFVQTGRMRELMSVFAATSKLMLVLKAEGRPWRTRKDRVGRELGIWELGGGSPSVE